jgi:hypothetical protein
LDFKAVFYLILDIGVMEWWRIAIRPAGQKRLYNSVTPKSLYSSTPFVHS